MAVHRSPGGRSALDPRLAEAVTRGLSADQTEASITADYLEGHDPRSVGRISDELRRVLDETLYQALGWQALQRPPDIVSFVTEATRRSKLIALVLSASGRGHVREAAVLRIQDVPGPFSLALLVNRLNDWVPNVRRVAEGRLSEMSAALDHGIVAGCIEYLWRFDEYGRASATGRELVGALVDDEITTACLREWILQNSDDRTVRLVQHLLQSPALDDLLVELATRHKHPRVRALAARTALEGVFSWRTRTLQKRPISSSVDRVTLALSLLKDRSTDVQYHALQHLSQSLHDNATLEKILKQYLLHPRPKLSDTAQWRLRKLGVDWLAWIRHEFEVRPLDLALARLLGRVGTTADGEALWSSAQRAPDRTRLAFSLAAARLKQADAIEAAKRMALHDPDLSRSRTASAALLDAQEFIPTEDLIKAASATREFAPRGLLVHVRRHSVIDQLKILCRLEAGGCPPQGYELDRLGRRLNRGKFDPAAAQLEELSGLSAGCPRVAGWMRRLQLT